MRGLATALNSSAIEREANLAVNRTQIEQNRSLLKVDILLRSLELLLEGVVPDEGDGVDMVLVGGNGESGLDEAEGFEVALKEIAAGGGGGIGLALEIGAVVLEGLEVVFEVLGVALGVIEGDEVAERAVEIELGGFLLEDGEHDVGTGAGR